MKELNSHYNEIVDCLKEEIKTFDLILNNINGINMIVDEETGIDVFSPDYVNSDERTKTIVFKASVIMSRKMACNYCLQAILKSKNNNNLNYTFLNNYLNSEIIKREEELTYIAEKEIKSEENDTKVRVLSEYILAMCEIKSKLNV